MRTIWKISLVALAVVLVLAFLFFYPLKKVHGPITCTSDKQCGGSVQGERFCKDGNVYASAQQNTCHKPGTEESVCETTYGDQLVEECEIGCSAGLCLTTSQ